MPKENQRVAISKRLLKDGIMRLLEEKNINEIKINELCQESGINRTTFYRHYQTPHDVLLEIEFDLMADFYESSVSVLDVKQLRKYAVCMCNFLWNNKEMIKVFIRNNTDSDLTRIFQNFTDGFLASRKVLYKGKTMDRDTLDLMTTFFAYGVYSLVRQWLIEDIQKTPEEIAELIIGSFNRDFTFQ